MDTTWITHPNYASEISRIVYVISEWKVLVCEEEAHLGAKRFLASAIYILIIVGSERRTRWFAESASDFLPWGAISINGGDAYTIYEDRMGCSTWAPYWWGESAWAWASHGRFHIVVIQWQIFFATNTHEKIAVSRFAKSSEPYAGRPAVSRLFIPLKTTSDHTSICRLYRGTNVSWTDFFL